jgi:hypothetical protein
MYTVDGEAGTGAEKQECCGRDGGAAEDFRTTRFGGNAA